MKFGKRQSKEQDAEPGVPDFPPAAPAAEPVVEGPAEPYGTPPDSLFGGSWTVPGAQPEPIAEQPAPIAEPPAPIAEQPAPIAEQPMPTAEPPPVIEEPILEGEAVELFTDEPPVVDPAPAPRPPPPPSPLEIHRHEPAPAPAPMPFPVADQPVAVISPDSAGVPITTLGDAGEAFASGHAAGPGHVAGPGPSWQEPVKELADERPELVVAAAFAGGLVAAMILRRLGR